jgi:hypothetical protein
MMEAIQNRKTNSMALSLQANYTDWATATCRQNLVPTLADRGVSRGQRGGTPRWRQYIPPKCRFLQELMMSGFCTLYELIEIKWNKSIGISIGRTIHINISISISIIISKLICLIQDVLNFTTWRTDFMCWFMSDNDWLYLICLCFVLLYLYIWHVLYPMACWPI